MRQLSPDMERRIMFHKQGHSAAEIARMTGYEQATISSWLRRHGYKPNGGHGGYRLGCGRKKRV